jgi:hypothetical protein
LTDVAIPSDVLFSRRIEVHILHVAAGESSKILYVVELEYWGG